MRYLGRRSILTILAALLLWTSCALVARAEMLPAATINLPTTARIARSGIHVAPGYAIRVQASGIVNTWPDPEINNPDNGPDGNPYPCKPGCLLPTAHYGALIARIGAGPWIFSATT